MCVTLRRTIYLDLFSLLSSRTLSQQWRSVATSPVVRRRVKGDRIGLSDPPLLDKARDKTPNTYASRGAGRQVDQTSKRRSTPGLTQQRPYRESSDPSRDRNKTYEAKRIRNGTRGLEVPRSGSSTGLATARSDDRAHGNKSRPNGRHEAKAGRVNQHYGDRADRTRSERAKNSTIRTRSAKFGEVCPKPQYTTTATASKAPKYSEYGDYETQHSNAKSKMTDARSRSSDLGLPVRDAKSPRRKAEQISMIERRETTIKERAMVSAQIAHEDPEEDGAEFDLDAAKASLRRVRANLDELRKINQQSEGSETTLLTERIRKVLIRARIMNMPRRLWMQVQEPLTEAMNDRGTVDYQFRRRGSTFTIWQTGNHAFKVAFERSTGSAKSA